MAGNSIGEPFEDYVNGQIIARQKLQGESQRSQDQIQYLSNRNAWIKLASGVHISSSRMELLTKNANPLITDANITPGKNLAQTYVLFNGLTDFKGNDPISRSGVTGDNRAYGVGGTDFGYSPMPGIVDMEFRCLNRGSIKKATLKIKAHNREQFDIIDVLYLRLGYSVFIEWGYDKYIDNSGSLQQMGDTLIDGKFWEDKYDKSDYSKWIPEIETRREESDGNYDGAFGTISNFSWDFNNDGTYDIKVEIISLGNIAESLKINLSPVNATLVNTTSIVQIKSTIDTLDKKEVDGIESIDFDKITQEKFNNIFPGLEEGLQKFLKTLKNDDNNTYYGGDKPNFEWESLGEEGVEGDNQILSYWRRYNVPYTVLGVQTGGITTDQIALSKFYFKIGTEPNQLSEDQKNKILNEFLSPSLLKDTKPQALLDKYGINAINAALNESFQFNNYINKLPADTNDPPNPAKAYAESPTGKNYPKFLNKETNQIFSTKDFPQNFPTFYNEYAHSIIGNFYGGNSMIVTSGKKQDLTNQQAAKLIFNNIGSSNFINNFRKTLIKYIEHNKQIADDMDEDNEVKAAGAKEVDITQGDVLTDSAKANQLRNKSRIHSLLYDIMEKGTYSGISHNKSQIMLTDVFALYAKGTKTYKAANAINHQGGIIKSRYTHNLLTHEFSSGPRTGFFIFRSHTSHYPTESNVVGDITYIWESGDFVCLNEIMKGNEDEDTLPGLNQNFMRLGAFLNYIQDLQLLKIDSDKKMGVPVIKFDTDPDKNICYVMDNTISLDIRKLIVSNKFFIRGLTDTTITDPETGEEMRGGNITSIFDGLNEFVTKNGDGFLEGKLMNIYLSFAFIQEVFDDVNDEGDIILYDCLKKIATEINSSLGNVNNIEPVITEENVYRFIETSQIPHLPKYTSPNEEVVLNVYGYNTTSSPKTSNFIHNIGLSTQISKNYATMITIGATANGGVPGIEATAFSKWNYGIIDRFKNNITDQFDESTTTTFKESKAFKSAQSNYNNMMSNTWGIIGLDSSEQHNVSDEIIKSNMEASKTWYKTEKTLKAIEAGKDGSIESSVGFLPFNLKIDMDGLSGIKIYNRVQVNTDFLPSNYPETLEFIITQVNHKLSNNGWVTSLETIATAKNQQV